MMHEHEGRGGMMWEEGDWVEGKKGERKIGQVQ